MANQTHVESTSVVMRRTVHRQLQDNRTENGCCGRAMHMARSLGHLSTVIALHDAVSLRNSEASRNINRDMTSATAETLYGATSKRRLCFEERRVKTAVNTTKLPTHVGSAAL